MLEICILHVRCQCPVFLFSSQSCDFIKKRDDTVLRVVWNGDIRLINIGPKGASARRWFFTINGKECSDPRTIDTQLYVSDSDSSNHRQQSSAGIRWACFVDILSSKGIDSNIYLNASVLGYNDVPQ